MVVSLLCGTHDSACRRAGDVVVCRLLSGSFFGSYYFAFGNSNFTFGNYGVTFYYFYGNSSFSSFYSFFYSSLCSFSSVGSFLGGVAAGEHCHAEGNSEHKN